MKKSTKTVVKEYDTEGKLIKETETTVEEEIENNQTIPYIPNIPTEPISPINPYPWYPNYPITTPTIWCNTDGSKNITVTYKAES